MERLLIVGQGGHAKCVAEAAARFDVCGMVTVRSRDELVEAMRASCADTVFPAIGANHVRERVAGFIDCSPVIVHPSAVIAPDVEIGAGTVIMPGVMIRPGSRIGRGVIVNTRASIDHDCELGDFCALAPGVVLSGNVRIGAGSWIGTSAAVIHGRTIGEHTVIGAGSVVVRDVPSLVVAYGNPCRVVRSREVGDPYL